MKAWWNGRSRREQLLLGALGGLALLTAIWFGVVGPLQAAERAAQARLARAVAAEAAIDRGLAELAALRRGARAPVATRPIADVVAETAAGSGLTLARSEPDPEGGLRIGLQAAPPSAVFQWLATLQRSHGLAPLHLTVLKGDDGGLDVDATLVAVAP